MITIGDPEQDIAKRHKIDWEKLQQSTLQGDYHYWVKRERHTMLRNAQGDSVNERIRCMTPVIRFIPTAACSLSIT